jgi:hypothetical protein
VDESSENFKLEIVVTEEEFEEIQKLKALRSHSNENIRDLVSTLVREDLKKSTKRPFDSIHKLQFEHIYPFALGGKHSPENIRLLCQSHNQLFAIQQFGLEKTKSQ